MRAVFFDRDGVLNDVNLRDGLPYPPANRGELRLAPDARESLLQLKAAGFLLIVVTNQPDVARGAQSRAEVESINADLASQLPLDEILTCWHDDRDACSCRKPKPGMLLDAAARHKITLNESFLVGDRWRDIDAGAAAGCRTVLIDRQYRERSAEHSPDFRAQTLTDATRWILRTRSDEG